VSVEEVDRETLGGRIVSMLEEALVKARAGEIHAMMLVIAPEAGDTVVGEFALCMDRSHQLYFIRQTTELLELIVKTRGLVNHHGTPEESKH